MRGFIRGVGGALLAAVLCLFVFDVQLAAAAERTANVVYIEGPSWPATSLDIEALADGTVVRLTDCQGSGSSLTVHRDAGQVAHAEHFSPALLCSSGKTLINGTKVGVARLPIRAGEATVKTRAVYLDPRNTFNVVTIPALPDPIAADFDGTERYVFTGLHTGISRVRAPQDSSASRCGTLVPDDEAWVTERCGLERSTTFALFTDAGRTVRVDIALLDADNLPLERNGVAVVESIDVSGFTFYPLRTQSQSVMNAIVTAQSTSAVSPPLPAADVFAVAFAGFATGGSPDTIVPTRELAH